MNKSARQLRNEYLRAWRAKHPDRVRVYNLRYWERQAERQKQVQEVRDEQA